jgi:hypothetical protein
MARPVALEAIRVTVDRLEARRRTATYSVHTVSRETRRSSPATIATDLVRSNMPWMPQLCPPGGLAGNDDPRRDDLQPPDDEPPVIEPPVEVEIPDETNLVDPGQTVWVLEDLCIRYRGEVIRPDLCVDDRTVPAVFLSAYGAEEIYAIDYISAPRPQVRLYTERFMERGRRIRPLALGCHRPRREAAGGATARGGGPRISTSIIDLDFRLSISIIDQNLRPSLRKNLGSCSTPPFNGSATYSPRSSRRNPSPTS